MGVNVKMQSFTAQSVLPAKTISNLLTLSQRQILDSSKLKEFADDNFKFDENGRKFSKRVENTVVKNVTESEDEGVNDIIRAQRT